MPLLNRASVILAAGLLAVTVCGRLAGEVGVLVALAQGAAAAPKGPYFGMTPPGSTPVLFAPGVVSTGLSDRDVAISQDGREFYFGVTFRTIATIMVSRLVDGGWTPPEVASFASDAAYYHMEPCLSPDGRRVFFLTNRPRAGEAPKPGWAHQNIWAADRMASGTWGEPYDLGAPINVDSGNYFPSMTRDGTLYFIRTKAPGKDASVYRARPQGRGFAEPERLPDTVNAAVIFNAFVAPDESYLIAGVDGRDDSTPPKRANYYVFFRRADLSWTSGTNLGPAINDPLNTVHSPYVSPDGRYFFFASNAPAERGRTSLKGLTLRQLTELNSSPRNGNADIYWVDAGAIQALRATAK
jgi:hypothetical protein